MQVGRPGPVCPFIPRAMQQQSLHLAVVGTAGHNTVDTIKKLVEGMVDRFLALEPKEAPGADRLAAYCVLCSVPCCVCGVLLYV